MRWRNTENKQGLLNIPGFSGNWMSWKASQRAKIGLCETPLKKKRQTLPGAWQNAKKYWVTLVDCIHIATEQTQAVSQHRLSPALKRRRHGIWGPLISHHVSVGGHKKSTGNAFHIWNYGCYKCNHGQVCGCVKRSRNDGIQVRQWKSRRRRAPLMWSLVRPHCHSRQRLISQCSIHGTTESCSPTPV